MRRRLLAPILALVLALAAAALASGYFDDAFPIITLELEMDREAALESARSIAAEREWPTAGFRQATSFGQDQPLAQTYIELEAGGREVWARIVEGERFAPYTWTVRQFRQGERVEARVRFTPEGQAYGFRLELPEDEPGPSLRSDSARALAERVAAARWTVPIDSYRLIESGSEITPGGRRDHRFVYERLGDAVPAAAGDDSEAASFRLRLRVSGASVSEVTRFIHVPETFERRFSGMRATNELIAFISVLAAGALYILGGCVVGLFLLLRRRAVRWRKPLFWGAVVAAFVAAGNLNSLPLAWMDYDTAVPVQRFLIEQIVGALGTFVIATALLAVVFMAAEGMTRWAFPRKPRLWRLWSRGVANSTPLLERTFAGYAFTGFFIAYIIAFYLFVVRPLGWWAPAETLVNPNLLATYAPWLSGVGISLLAATSEEALFRAIPLAGAALIGDRLGGRKWWIGGALVLQAVIFAAAHANYPNQPAYVRLVELLLPALAFGVVYLRYGLLPGIIAHFTYDLLWLSLPLFASSAPGLGMDRVLVLAFGLVPLGVVLVARARWGARHELPAWARNEVIAPAEPGQWGVEEVAGEGEAEPRVNEAGRKDEAEARADALGRKDEAEAGAHEVGRPAAAESRAGAVLAIIGAGAVGVALWLFASSFEADAPPLNVTRSEAVRVARSALAERDVQLEGDWRVLASVRGGVGTVDRYVWREAGEERYTELLGRYMAPPHWRVRFARFEGGVSERAEEYYVRVGPSGEAFRVSHLVPEGAPGASLDEQAARMLAYEAVMQRYGTAPEALREVGAEADQRPERTDWTFTFANPTVELPEGARARVVVEIAGDRVVDSRRSIRVPEDWLRERRGEWSRAGVRRTAAGLALGLFGLVALVIAIVRWSRGRFSLRAFLVIGGTVLLISGLQAWNDWPSMVASFRTDQPFSFQFFTLMAIRAFAAVLTAGAFGLLAGMVHSLEWTGPRVNWNVSLLAGSSLGLLLAGIRAGIRAITPDTTPVWPTFAPADSRVPVLAGAFDTLISFAIVTLGILALMGGLRWLHRRYGMAPPAAAAAAGGVIAAGMLNVVDPVLWLSLGVAAGAVLLVLYAVVLRFGFAVVPAVVATRLVLDGLILMVREPYPGALWAAALGIVFLVPLAVVWSRILNAERADATVDFRPAEIPAD